jgi:purine-binding chemotaxis protein CheW
MLNFGAMLDNKYITGTAGGKKMGSNVSVNSEMVTTAPAATMAIGSNVHVKDDVQQYLTFTLGGETYGVDILRVQEIRGWTPVTCIPNVPAYLRGVLNLRGNIVPIVDMRMRFKLEHAEFTPVTVVIVLSVQTLQGERVIGMVVDSVSDVLDITAEEIKPSPDFGSAVDTDFINGLATTNDEMVMLLDVDKMLTDDEIKGLETVSTSD